MATRLFREQEMRGSSPRTPTKGEMMGEPQIPQELLEKIERQQKDGVAIEFNDDRTAVTAIHWRPGERNALAALIIGKVQGPMKLELDGHEYLIQPMPKENPVEAEYQQWM